MSSTKFYLDLRGKAKDGKGSLVIVLANNRTTTTVATGVRLSPNEWNGNEIVRIPNAHILNVKINEQKNSLDKKLALLSMEERFSRMTAPQVKKELLGKEEKSSKSTSLVEIFHEYMETDMTEGTRKIYDSTLKKVIAFAGASADIRDIDLAWIHRFDKFLSQTQGVNGRAIYLRDLRTVCNYALHNRIISSYPFENYSVKTEPTRKRNITIDKLREFAKFPVDSRVARYRDYFFLMFYLIGINAADLFRAKPSDIVNGRFEYIRAKTHKKYSIKIEPEAQEIIDRYRGKEYLLDALDNCKDYKNFLKKLNHEIKNIGPVTWEMIPDPDNLFAAPSLEKHVDSIVPDISTYYARHTWATVAHDLGISMDTISQAMGHANGNKTTLIYVKQDLSKVDEANRKVIDSLFDI